MYCHLCQSEGSPTHDGSSGHLAARELAAVAVDRLAKHVEASGDSATGTNVLLEADKAKTAEAVSYCDFCNTVVPIDEHSAHIRLKNHALALLNEQMFEELVRAYVNEGDLKSTPSGPTDDRAFVDETEAANTYTCHFCSLNVPQVFKAEHERSTRHLASRILGLAAARRASSSLSRSDGAMEKSNSNFTGKMMKKLLKAYTWRVDEKVNEEKESEEKVNGNEETEPTQPTQKRLTSKEYFTDILPYLPYVGSFHTVIIDDTEFVTIQILNETLKIHVNNFNGLHFDKNDMNCRLCDGFLRMYYSSKRHEDKLHVMSLGHIRNVFTAFDTVHLIRKIDNSHSLCGLCNVPLDPNSVDDHIYKDILHTKALTEALQRGKQYKENKDNLKVMICAPKQSGFMKPNQFNRWNYGVPHPVQPCSGTLFGTQSDGFGSTQNTGLFGSTQNTGFASTQNTGFGSTQNAGFGSNQTNFGSTQGNRFVAATANSGANQNSFGGNQNNLGGSQSGFVRFQSQQPVVINSASTNQSTPADAQKYGLFGNAQSTSFVTANAGAPQENNNASFGNGQTNTTIFGNSQAAQTDSAQHSNATGFGNTQQSLQSFANITSTGMKFVFPQKNTAGDTTGQNNQSSNSPDVVINVDLQQENTAPTNSFEEQSQTKILSVNEKETDSGDAQSEKVEVPDGTQLKKSNTIQPQRKLNYSSSSDSD